MLAEESVRSGKLEEALTQLQDQVRKSPAEPRYRVFLFQLFAVLGRWDRALTQLKVVGELDASSDSMVQTYAHALRCELIRAEVFAGRRTPIAFGQPEPWLAMTMEALRLCTLGKTAEGEALRAQAFEQAPATSGNVDGQPFVWIADADPRMGPVLEAIVNGKYYWIPFQRLKAIRFEKPTDLRDMVWAPAYLTLANGGETVALIPTRYPGSEQSADPQILMSRKTEWPLAPEGSAEAGAGRGQRLLATDVSEYPILDVRVVTLDSSDG